MTAKPGVFVALSKRELPYNKSLAFGKFPNLDLTPVGPCILAWRQTNESNAVTRAPSYTHFRVP